MIMYGTVYFVIYDTIIECGICAFTNKNKVTYLGTQDVLQITNNL